MSLSSSIRPLICGKRVAGTARTARITAGDNGAIHRAVHLAKRDELLVVDGGSSERFGPFGDLLAAYCMSRGVVGGVFDCTIRDSADISALGFQVFSRGYCPNPTDKAQPGEVDKPVRVGGVLVIPGDIIVGDDDGVVVIPKTIAQNVFDRAVKIAKREEEIRARILAGQSTYEIFDLANRFAESHHNKPKEEVMKTLDTFFNIADLDAGLTRTLAPGIEARIFVGEQAMVSVVNIEPDREGVVHSHAEEQWGVLLKGSGVRSQDGEVVEVTVGDFWLTPAHVKHGFRAGPDGATILDVFAPPREAYRGGGSGFESD